VLISALGGGEFHEGGAGARQLPDPPGFEAGLRRLISEIDAFAAPLAGRGLGEVARVENPLGLLIDFFDYSEHPERPQQRYDLRRGAEVAPSNTAMHDPEVVYARLADHSSSLVSSIVAVHRPRVDPAVTRLLDLLTSQ
jgi:hypothetical protein